MAVFRGTPVSEGTAAGELYLPDRPAADALRHHASRHHESGHHESGHHESGHGESGDHPAERHGPGGMAAVASTAARPRAAGRAVPPTPAAEAGGVGGGAAAGPATTVTAQDVRAAFAAVAADRTGLAAALRAAGRDAEAGIVEIGALIAADPALFEPAIAAMAGASPASGTRPAPDAAGVPGAVPATVAAIAGRDAAEAQAAILAALPDPDLAQRAGDVRQVAQAVIARLAGSPLPPAPPDAPFILIRHEVDPADIIRLADGGNLVGAVSVAGGASSHAAIIARGLGLPMLVGVDAAVLSDDVLNDAVLNDAGLNDAVLSSAMPVGRLAGGALAGCQAILDAASGELRTDPSEADLARLRAAASAGGMSGAIAPPGSGRPRLADSAGTAAVPGTAGRRGTGLPVPGTASPWSSPGQVHAADGELVTVLCNVASAAEARLGLAGGAGGVGLLRTEIAFTRATGWPSRTEHEAALRPVFSLLAGRRAVVRLVDFAGDKIPPFPGAAGLAAFLGAPHALDDQLTAILAAGSGTALAIMIPMVRSLDEVRLVRARLASAARAAGTDAPPLGMMVELAATAADAARFASQVDFFSIGTNDLTADVLGRDRVALGPADAAAPPVLAAIGDVVAAARQAGIGVSVCGDAAADPAVLPHLLAAGVRTLSVGAAKVPRVAEWVAQVDTRADTGADTRKAVIPHG